MKILFTTYSGLGEGGAEISTKILMEEFDTVIRFPFPLNVKDVGEMDDFALKQAKAMLAFEIQKISKESL